MNKRGEENSEMSVWFFISLAAGLFVGFLAWYVAVSYSEGTIYEKELLAKEIALQISAWHAAPGDGYIVLNDLYGYSVKVTSEEVIIFESLNDPFPGKHTYPRFSDDDFEYEFIEPQQLYVQKKGDIIFIADTGAGLQ